MKKTQILLPLIAVFLFSCQKEVEMNLPANTEPPQGKSDGDLLVKALSITLQTNDTCTVTFQWDNAKRLIEYKTAGKVYGMSEYLHHKIERNVEGKINQIFSKVFFANAQNDSVVYDVHYLPNSTRLAYVIGNYINAVIERRDSAVFAYNTEGRIVSKETFSEILGMQQKSTEAYGYDEKGNIAKVTTTAFIGGMLQSGGVTTCTYGTHKSAVTLGDEAFIAIGVLNCTKNNLIKETTNAVASGTNYTIAISQQQFNSFDRPQKELASISAYYDLQNLYYYQ